jgi:hypothetical protein
MKRSHKIAIGIAASLGLTLGAAAAIAHPGAMDGAMGMHGEGAMAHGPMAGMAHGPMGGMGHGAMGGHGAQTGAQLMTPEERTAMQEKMRNAKTPEERQKIAEANRAEMQKRAKEKGVTLPEPHGPHGGFGPRSGSAPK